MTPITLDELPYPYCNLPTNGKPLTPTHLYDVAKPLLSAVRGILTMCAAAAGRNELPVEEMNYAFSVMAGQIAMVELLLTRVEP